ITYYIEVSPGAIGCTGYDTVSIRVLPDDIQLINRDTTVWEGASVHIAAFGDPAFDYRWSPGIWTSDSTIIDPVITPHTSVLFTLTASYPGCPDIVKNLFIDVQPNPFVYIGPDRDKCQWDTIQFFPSVVPNTYPYYTYTWTPATGVSDPTSLNIVFSGQTNVLPLTLTGTTPAGCTGDDEVDITVHPGNFGSLTPLDISICPRDSVYYVADGGVTYEWTPAYYLTDPTSPLAVASPPTDMQYTLYITDQYGCLDTFETFINVHPDAVMNFGEDVTIYPGESVQLEPYGNCLYF